MLVIARARLSTAGVGGTVDVALADPDPAFRPQRAAVGGLMTGLIFHPLAVPIGLAVVLLFLAGWFWPTHEPVPLYSPERPGKTGAVAAITT